MNVTIKLDKPKSDVLISSPVSRSCFRETQNEGCSRGRTKLRLTVPSSVLLSPDMKDYCPESVLWYSVAPHARRSGIR